MSKLSFESLFRATPKTIPTSYNPEDEGIVSGPLNRPGFAPALADFEPGSNRATPKTIPTSYNPEDEGIVSGALNRPGFAPALADFERGSNRATPKTIPPLSSLRMKG